jgi:hypothetical protein
MTPLAHGFYDNSCPGYFSGTWSALLWKTLTPHLRPADVRSGDRDKMKILDIHLVLPLSPFNLKHLPVAMPDTRTTEGGRQRDTEELCLFPPKTWIFLLRLAYLCSLWTVGSQGNLPAQAATSPFFSHWVKLFLLAFCLTALTLSSCRRIRLFQLQFCTPSKKSVSKRLEDYFKFKENDSVGMHTYNPSTGEDLKFQASLG